MSETAIIGDATLYRGDCREVLPSLAILKDAAYFKIARTRIDATYAQHRMFA